MAKAFTRMSNLEKRKQLQPKFSRALQGIADFLNLRHFFPKVNKTSDEEGYSSIELPGSVEFTEHSVSRSK